MADINFGSDEQGFQRALEQMEQLAEAQAELEAKERSLRGEQTRASVSIKDNASELQRAIEETRGMASAVEALTARLSSETSALQANTAAWAERSAAMADAGRVSGSAGVRRTPTRAQAAANVAEGEAVTVAGSRPSAAPRVAETSPYAAATPTQLRAQAAAMEANSQRFAAAISAVSSAEQESAISLLRAARTGAIPAAPQESAVLAAARRVERQSAVLPSAAPVSPTPVTGTGERVLTPPPGAAASAASVTEVAHAEDTATASANRLAEAQLRANAAYKQSVSAYAESSTALSRHGALTTEFIQAFARGDVTLKEFTSQMTSTIGKFGGWAIAGAAVYGAYDAVKKLGQGAKETQEGVQNLARFIPNVQTGRGRDQAESTFRNLSTQLNLPIGDVTSAMTVMARVFHDVADAGEATRAVLLASRLDQIPQAQSEQYLTGIAQSLGQTGPGGGQFLVGVIDSLNSLQNRYGARVNQTLPALARATPAAVAGGLVTTDPTTGKLDTSLLEGLVTAGVRAGLPGAQVGTALLRSVGTFAFRPQSLDTFRQYGIEAPIGNYAQLIKNIEARLRRGDLSGNDERNIAQALGGPLLGSRALLPMVRQLATGQVAAYQQTAAHPPQTGMEELQHVLGGVGEQAHRLGIELENIGSELESAGILEPVQIALQAVGAFGSLLEHALAPLDHLTAIVNDLGEGGRKVVGVLALLAGASALRRTRLGGALESGLSRVPGLGGLENRDRQVVQRTLGDYRSLIVPQTTRELEAVRRRVTGAASVAAQRGTSAGRLRARANELQGTPGYAAADEEASLAESRFAAAQDRAQALAVEEAETLGRLVQQTALVAALESDQVSLTQKANYLVNERLSLLADGNSRLRQGVEDQTAVTLGAMGAATTRRGGNQDRAGGGGLTPGEGAIIGGLGLAGGVAAGRVAEEAFVQSDPATQRAAAAEAAEQEQPGTLRDALSTEAPPPLQFAPPPSRLSRVAGGAASVADHPFALLLGTQLANAVLPGKVGDAVGSVGGIAATGAFLSSTGIFGNLAQGATRFGARALNRIPGVNLGTEGLSEGALRGLSNPLLGVGLATAAAGATTAGTGGAIEAALGGATLGATIGSIVPIGGTVVGGLVGGLAGGAAGLVAQHFLAPHQTHLSAQARARQAALTAAPAQVPQASATDVYNFGYQFAGELQGAYNNGDQTTAQKQQQEINALIPHFTQLLTDAGVRSRTGITTQDYLEQIIGQSAISEGYQKQPALVGQGIASATQALTGAANTQFQLQLAQARRPGDFLGAISDEQRRLAAQRRGAREPVTALEGEARSARSLINQPSTPITEAVSGLENMFGKATGPVVERAAALKKLQDALKSDDTRLASAKQLLHGLDTKSMEQVQSDAATALQGAQQQISDVTEVATGRAGGNRMQQLNAQVAGAQRNLATIARYRPFLAPSAYQDQHAQAVSQLATYQTQQVQQQGTEMQARQASRLAQIDQNVNPVAYARRAAQNAQAYLHFVQSHAHDFDPSDIQAAIGAAAQANQTVAQSIADYNNSVAQAYEQLNEAQNPANAAAVAAGQVRQGQTALRNARNLPQRVTARAQILAGHNAQAEANRSAADTNYQIRQAQESGDPVAQAITGIAQARHDLATALGPDEVRAARLELAQANASLHQAQQDQITLTGQLAASSVNDPIRRDSILLANARKKLAQAVAEHMGKQVIQQDRSDVNSQVLQKFNDGISNQLSDIDYLQSTLQISSQDALARLQKLAQKKGLSPDQKRQIGSAIYNIETAQDNTSLFDLAPGGQGVRVPTIYDAATAAARERQRLGEHAHGRRVAGASGLSGNAHDVATLGGASIKTRQGALATSDLAVERAITAMHQTLARSAGAPGATVGQIIVNVGAGEASKVADVFDRVLGTRVNSRMRAAGVRGNN